MEEKGEKVGWVEKRSAYLKQWRMRWMVLTHTYLCTFKTENTAEAPTERIPISSILEVSHLPGDPQRPHCFKINTKSRLYTISTLHSEVVLDWVISIQSAILQLGRPNHQLIERQKHSQQTLESTFSALQSIITEREVSLTAELETMHLVTLAQARDELNAFNKVVREVESNFEAFREIQERTDLDMIQKLRLVNVLSKDSGSFSEFDRLADSSTRVFIPSKVQVDELMNSCVSVALANPFEYRARRTCITRALKWRYNGERIDAITFSVSKAIVVTGIGFCRPCKANGTIVTKVLKLAQGTSTSSTVLYTHPSESAVAYDPRESVQKIALCPPVPLKTGVTYTILMKMEGSASYKCVDCYKTMVSEGEVKWAFSTTLFPPTDQSNRTDVVCGPIADFYYMLAGDR